MKQKKNIKKRRKSTTEVKESSEQKKNIINSNETSLQLYKQRSPIGTKTKQHRKRQLDTVALQLYRIVENELT